MDKNGFDDLKANKRIILVKIKIENNTKDLLRISIEIKKKKIMKPSNYYLN